MWSSKTPNEYSTGFQKQSQDIRKKVRLELHIYLIPSNHRQILSAVKYMLPVNLRGIHAFQPNIEAVTWFKLAQALLNSSKTPSLFHTPCPLAMRSYSIGGEGGKEKLFKSQKGLCKLCGRPIDETYLLQNSVHMHHIMPIKKGGEKLKLSNLALAHIWCHKEHKH